jgi:hypothetical protein
MPKNVLRPLPAAAVAGNCPARSTTTTSKHQQARHQVHSNVHSSKCLSSSSNCCWYLSFYFETARHQLSTVLAMRANVLPAPATVAGTGTGTCPTTLKTCLASLHDEIIADDTFGFLGVGHGGNSMLGTLRADHQPDPNTLSAKHVCIADFVACHVACNGRLDVLIWARRNDGCNQAFHTCHKAPSNGHLHVLIWVRQSKRLLLGLRHDLCQCSSKYLRLGLSNLSQSCKASKYDLCTLAEHDMIIYQLNL